MTKDVVEYLGALPPSAASFLGSFTGACIGLIAVVCGALFNAWLNRRRDDRLRRIERETLRLALITELRSIEVSLRKNAQVVEERGDAQRGTLMIPNSSSNHIVFDACRDKLLILTQGHFAEVLDCYLTLTSMFDALTVLAEGKTIQSGSSRSLIALPARFRETYQVTAETLADRFKGAIEKLEAPDRRGRSISWLPRKATDSDAETTKATRA